MKASELPCVRQTHISDTRGKHITPHIRSDQVRSSLGGTSSSNIKVSCRTTDAKRSQNTTDVRSSHNTTDARGSHHLSTTRGSHHTTDVRGSHHTADAKGSHHMSNTWGSHQMPVTRGCTNDVKSRSSGTTDRGSHESSGTTDRGSHQSSGTTDKGSHQSSSTTDRGSHKSSGTTDRGSHQICGTRDSLQVPDVNEHRHKQKNLKHHQMKSYSQTHQSHATNQVTNGRTLSPATRQSLQAAGTSRNHISPSSRERHKPVHTRTVNQASNTKDQQQSSTVSRRSHQTSALRGSHQVSDTVSRRSHQTSALRGSHQVSDTKRSHRSISRRNHESLDNVTRGSHQSSDTRGSHQSSDTRESHQSSGTIESHQSSDTRESHESSGTRESHQSSGIRESYQSSDPRESHQSSGTRESHQSSGTRESHQSSGTRESHQSSDTRESHQSSGTRESHESSGTRESHQSSGTRESHESSDTRESHQLSGTRESHESSGTRESHQSSGTRESHQSSDTRESHQSSGTRESHESRDRVCAAIEQEYVHDVYNKTAHHFVDVKYKAWPRVKEFLLSLEPGSMVGDIGCGSGKYLGINKDLMMLGCDYSINLLSGAQHGSQHGSRSGSHQVLACDNLSLPFKDGCFDAVISIGVIHHFTTPSRRAKAIRELARVLRPGGKVMIYVWAMEQKHRKFKSQDVLVPWHLKTKHHKQVKPKTNHVRNMGDDEVFEAAEKNTSESISMSQSQKYKQTNQSLSDSVSHGSVNVKDEKEKSTSPEFRDFFHKYFAISKKGSPPAISDVSPTSVKVIPSFDIGIEGHNTHSESCPHRHECHHHKKGDNKRALSAEIKTKFFHLIGINSRAPKLKTAPKKPSDFDVAYKRMLDKIERDHELACQSGDNIPSSLAMEGFAVREFPASSCLELPVEAAVKSDHQYIIPCGALPELVNDHIPASNPPEGVANAERMQLVHQSAPSNNTKCVGYTQKCSDWLAYRTTSGENHKQLEPLNIDTPQYNTNRLPDSERPHTLLRHNRELIASDNEEWAQLTAKAIDSMQTQVQATDNVPRSQKLRLLGTSADLTCKCKTAAKATDTDKVDSKVGFKKKNCSESTVSSVSSMSSETESNLSDFEEMSVCAVCRGDSIDDTFQEMCAIDKSPSINGRLVIMDQEFENNQDDSLVIKNGQESSISNQNGHDLSLICRNGEISSVTCQVSSQTCSSQDIPSQNHEKSQIPSNEQSLEFMASCSVNSSIKNDEPSESISEHLNSFVRSPTQELTESTNTLDLIITNGDHTVPIHDHQSQPTFTTETLNKSASLSVLDQDKLEDDVKTADDAHKRFYHVFREDELVDIINKHVDSLHILDSFYDHANWCVVAEKVNVWQL